MKIKRLEGLKRFFTAIPVVGALLGALPAVLNAQGITYTLSPSARWIQWDDAVGFDQTRLLGGSAGIGFGRYVGLTGFYHIEDGIATDLASTGLTFPDGSAIASQLTEIRQMGGAVTLGLGTGSIVPVITGGGSLLRFAPEDGASSTQLSLDWGAGLKTALGEILTGEVLVESTNNRLDRLRLAPGFDPQDPAFPVDANSNDVLRNLTLRAGVGIQLGRRSMRGASDLDDAFAQRYQQPFSNFALAVEPLMGELDFDAATGLESQRMLGARAGFDFGQFFGLRGFYWRGTESNFQDFGSMRAWGGEAQFTLAAGPGLNPYLITGAGQIEWDDDFNADAALIPSDQTSLIVGGGVDFNFGPRIRATVAARDFILAGSNLYADQDLQDVSDPDQLVHNWQLSAGLKFVLGGSGIRANRPVPSPVPPVGGDSGAAAPTVPTPAAPATVPVAPTAVAPDVASPVPTAPATAADSARTAVSPTEPRTMVLPVPETGEIYIRFGEVTGQPILMRRDAGDSTRAVAQPLAGIEESLRRIVREEMAAGRTDDPNVSTADEARLRDMERRVEERLRAVEARERAAGTVVVRDEGGRETVMATESTGRGTREIRPYTGFATSPDVQLLLGVAADIGPLRPGSSVSLLPQFALGVGQGPSSMLLSLGFEYKLPRMLEGGRFDVQPLASIGPTLLKADDYEAGLTIFLGAASRIFKGNGEQKAYIFYGYQGADLFDQGRLLIGLRQMR